MDWISSPDIWIALLTLTSLEIVLGIDNIVFISILAGKLPPEQRKRARAPWASPSRCSRASCCCSRSRWIIKLTEPHRHDRDQELSGRDFIFLIGGLFLLGKSTWEIHEKLEGDEGHTSERVAASFASVIAQILILDVVFSLDSVITAVGLAEDVEVMIAAVVIAVGVMLLTSGVISDFVDKHPTMKILALSFLLLIGMSLLAEGFDQHIPKGYIYFAMAFSVGVEMLNLRLRGQDQRGAGTPAQRLHRRSDRGAKMHGFEAME